MNINYNSLTVAVRRAARNTFGAGSNDFDTQFYSYDPFENIFIPEFDYGVCTELSFDTEDTPFDRIPYTLHFHVIAPTETAPGYLHLYLGHYCMNVDAAEAAANELIDSGLLGSWSIENAICDCDGLEIGTTFTIDPCENTTLEAIITAKFAELCNNELIDKLVPLSTTFGYCGIT